MQCLAYNNIEFNDKCKLCDYKAALLVNIKYLFSYRR